MSHHRNRFLLSLALSGAVMFAHRPSVTPSQESGLSIASPEATSAPATGFTIQVTDIAGTPVTEVPRGEVAYVRADFMGGSLLPLRSSAVVELPSTSEVLEETLGQIRNADFTVTGVTFAFHVPNLGHVQGTAEVRVHIRGLGTANTTFEVL